MRIDRAKAVVVVVDVQERLSAVMDEAARTACERNQVVLIEMARRLGLPVVVSEQYKKGLGPTVAAVEQAIAAGPVALTRFEKMEFSCTESALFGPIYERLKAEGRTQWIVCGMETHICVYQSVRGLMEKGAAVHVVGDAVLSRTAENKAVGLRLCERAGAVVTCTETVVFDALQKAGSEEFKALSRLIK